MNREIGVKANYVVTKIDLEQMIDIFLPLWMGNMSKDTLRERAKKSPIIHKFFCGITKNRELMKRNWIYQYETHNLVPNVLRYSLATLISGTAVTPTFQCNKIAMGNDSTAPSNSDLILGNETARWDWTNRQAIDNVAYLDKFWSPWEVWWSTFLEIWAFVDWTNAMDTGYLLSRININETMSLTETLTVNATFTILW
jgi:hypothetical protein